MLRLGGAPEFGSDARSEAKRSGIARSEEDQEENGTRRIPQRDATRRDATQRDETRRDLPYIKHDEINLCEKCPPPLSKLRLRRDAAINVPRDLDELPSRGSDFNQTLAYISPGLLNRGLKNEEA
jgi:hypothetical protein